MANDKEKTPISRIEVEKAAELYAASYYELEDLTKTIKDAKKEAADEIDKDYKEQLESLTTEIEQHHKVLEDYSQQVGSEQTTIPSSGVTFGNFEKESYDVEKDSDTIDALAAFKKEFPTNYTKFLTGYPKFGKSKFDSLVADGHITLEKLNEMGIVKNSVSSFEVKVPKRK